MSAVEVLAAPVPMPERIAGLLADGQLEQAKKRLLDYARSSGSDELCNDAVALAGRLSRTLHTAQIEGRDASPDIAQITHAILNLVRLIEATPGAPPPKSERAPKSVRAESNVHVLRGPSPAPARSGRPGLAEARDALERDFNPVDVPKNAVFHCHGLGKTYRRGSTNFELRGVNCNIFPGEVVGLVGENGSGKTTFLSIVAGELLHSAGSLAYPMIDSASQVDWPTVRPCIAYVRQQPERWHGKLRDQLSLTATQAGIFGDRNHREVEFWLFRLGLERYAESEWDEISGGFKTRFELARALVRRPSLLILDEPLAALDVIAQRYFLQDLRDLASGVPNPLPMLVSSQHLYEIELIADRLLFLRDGTVVYHGDPNEVEVAGRGNLFELSCDWSRARLESIFLGLKVAPSKSGAPPVLPVRVEEFGNRYLVRTPDALGAEQVLGCLVEHHVRIEYFHDLSRSTRRLIEEEHQ